MRSSQPSKALKNWLAILYPGRVYLVSVESCAYRALLASFREMSFFHSPQSMGKLGSQSVRKSAIRLGSGLMALSLSLGAALPSLAADPFRSNSAYEIGEHTQAAFEAIFKEGDYVTAEAALEQAEQAEANEPLVHAMIASIEYLKGGNDLAEVARRADLTTAAAADLIESDPLRGHLYTAVGTFLKGAYVLKTEGVAKGTPQALSMLQTVFNSLDEAEAIDADDPELNLIKGYMDLMLAVNLPFSNPAEAIERMDAHGSPVYLAQRGIAVGYRDLEQYDAAMDAVNQAIAAAPTNPELMYLKAQIANRLGNQAESSQLYAEALTYADQLPDSLVDRITWEGCVVGGTNPQECSAQVGY